MATLHCLNPYREESSAHKKVEQQQYRTSLKQLFVQHKCTVMFKMNKKLFIMPPAGLPNKGLRKKALCLFTKKTFLKGVHPASCWETLGTAALSLNIWCLLVFFFHYWIVSMKCHSSQKIAKLSCFLLFPDLVPPFFKVSSNFLRSTKFSSSHTHPRYSECGHTVL